MKGKGEESATEKNPFANPRMLNEVSSEVKEMITLEKWRMRRYFQEEMSGMEKSIRSNEDSIVAASVRDLSDGHPSNNAETDRGKVSGEDNAIFDVPEELESGIASKWDDLRLDEWMGTDEVEAKVVNALLASLKSCWDKGSDRFQIMKDQVKLYVNAVAKQFRSAAELC